MNLRLFLISAAACSTLLLCTPGQPALTQPAPTGGTPDEQANARPLLHPLFTDDAVLQRDRPVPVWGWTTPGAQVTVKLDDGSKTTLADAAGHWTVSIGPFPAGGPHTLAVSSGAQSITRQNILFGDVWICSGEANMEMGIGQVNNAQQEIADANYPQIRLFTVPRQAAATPRNTVDGHWLVCTPANIAASGVSNGFSAAGYFFGRKLHQELNVPIGLVEAAWGDTGAEAWVSAGSLGTVPDLRPQLAALDHAANDHRSPEQQMTDWVAQNDAGIRGNWAAPTTSETGWITLPVPMTWQNVEVTDLSEFDGLAWYRRTVTVPAAWAGHDLTLRVGSIDDEDTTYWNGVAIGSTRGWNVQREYKIPGAQVQAGINVIAIRVLDNDGDGGMGGPADHINLRLDDNNVLPLAGDWKFRLSTPISQMAPPPVVFEPNNPHFPTVLYNGMIAPLVPYGIRGVVWYQGESNVGHRQQYGRLIPALIKDWRRQFGASTSFYLVQLAGYMAPDREPRNDDWPQSRDIQRATTQMLSTPTGGHIGLAVTLDIGDQNDVHPKNKQDVGLRLALSALAQDYGRTIPYSGPTLKSVTRNATNLVLTFDHAEGGLTLKGEANHVFAVAGADRNWFWAVPHIDGDRITLTSPMVPTPVAVRFGWSNMPTAFLYNGANLPAAPFQTGFLLTH